MKTITARIAAVALAVSIASAAYADPPDHSLPGTPGAPNCNGQTMAYLAQAFKNGVIDEAIHGIGGIAKASGLSNQEVLAIVNNFCNP